MLHDRAFPLAHIDGAGNAAHFVKSLFILSNSFLKKEEKLKPSRLFSLACDGQLPHIALTQFCTCLWSRAGRWASGQEAGQPPDANEWRGIVIRGALRTEHRTSTGSRNRPVNPVLRGGRDLKQRRSGSFRSQPVSTAGGLSRLVHLARRAERSPVPIHGISFAGPVATGLLLMSMTSCLHSRRMITLIALG